MSLSTEEAGPAADRPTAPGSNGPSPGGDRDPVSLLAERLLERGAGIAEQLLRLARVSADQALQRARRARSGLVLGFLLATAAVVVFVSAMVLVARGLSGGLTVWLGRSWLGELAAGLVLLGLLLAGSWSVRRRGDRARLRKLKEKYEGHEDTKHAPPENPGGIPAARASADARGSGAGSANDGR